MKKNTISLVCYSVLASLWLTSGVQSAEVSKADSIRKYAFLAKTSREKKEYPEAARYYRSLAKYQPNHRKTQSFLGEVLFKMKDYPGALDAYRHAVAIDSLHRISNLRLYQLYAQAGQPDSAAMAIERVLLQKPDDAQNRRNLADLYRRQERTADALQHYVKLVDNGQQDTALLQLLATLNEDLGNTEQALNWRQRLLVAQNEEMGGPATGQRKTMESVVELQIKTKDYQSAYESLLELAKMDTLNSYSYYSRLSELAQNNGQMAMHIRGLEGMAAANPGDLETIGALIEWNLGEGNQAAVKKWIAQGLKSNANDARLHLFKGDLLASQGAEGEAVAAFEVAKADPRWERVAQQRIWQLRPPETEEEKLKKAFFGAGQQDNE